MARPGQPSVLPVIALWTLARLCSSLSTPLVHHGTAITYAVPNPPSHFLCTNTGYLTQLGFLRNSYSLFTGHSGYPSNQSSFIYAMMLILAGDIESNPGPHHAAEGRWPSQSEWGGIYARILVPSVTFLSTGQTLLCSVMNVMSGTTSLA